jgi:hypothetical protein
LLERTKMIAGFLERWTTDLEVAPVVAQRPPRAAPSR